MKAQAAIALIAGLLANTAFASTALGELTFNAPECGDGKNNNINGDDCTAAVTQLLSQNCSGGVCSIPAATGGAQEAIISALVGECEAIVGAFANGQAVTFSQDSVQKAFPGFISECLSTSSSGDDGNPILTATDGVIRLVISNGIVGGGG
ncbi:hypothetical protein V8C35DRAFT_306119 [Trichoderma chlorosporum]